MTTAGDDRVGPVLVVEDDPAAIRLIEEAFAEMERPVDHVVVTDGVEAFDFLHGRGEYDDTPRPMLVLLDLGLPAKNGKQVLVEIRDDPGLRLLPVVVLSSHDDPGTVADCYAKGANAYLAKPDDYERLLTKLRTLVEFWTAATETPPSTPP